MNTEEFAKSAKGFAAYQRSLAKEALLPAYASRFDYDPRELAAVYLAVWRHGGRAPTQAVADHFQISRSAASKRVWRVRNELHLIPPASQGTVRAKEKRPKKKRPPRKPTT